MLGNNYAPNVISIVEGGQGVPGDTSPENLAARDQAVAAASNAAAAKAAAEAKATEASDHADFAANARAAAEAARDTTLSLVVSGRVVKDTRAQLFADLAYAAGTYGEVTNDPSPGLNGTYTKVGQAGIGSWTFYSPDTLQSLRVRALAQGESLNTLTGRADAIESDIAAVDARAADLETSKAAAGVNSDITQLSGQGGAGVDVLVGSRAVASAATTDIGAGTASLVTVTGTTAITSFGTAAKRQRTVQFAASLRLTHNGTSLILPGATDIITAAGDTAVAVSDASGNWTVTSYRRANAKAPADLQAFGAKPGASDNGAALTAARAATANNDIIRLPGKQGDTYAFPGGFDMSGRVIDPDPGLSISGVADFLTTGRVTRTLRIARSQSGALDEHYFVPDVYRLPAEKSLWLSPEGAERTTYSSINQTGAIYYDAPWTSDTLTPFAPTTTAADSATWTAPAAWRGPIVPVRPGQEIGGVFGATTDGGLSRAAYIQGTEGAAWIWGGTGGPLSITIKVRGSARSDTISGIQWPELANDPAWAPQNASWVIRPISHFAVEVLLNGVIVATLDLGVNGLGVVQAAGLMTYGSTGSGTAGVAQMYRARRRHRRGQPHIKALLIGDSKTDASFHANWPSWLAEWIDGTAGIRLTGIDNRAVSGENSLQQLVSLQSVGNNGATDAVIYIGTNDVQGGVSAAQTATNVGQMIDFLKAGQIVVTLVIPDLWYRKESTPGAGWGYPTANAEKGAATRAALIRLGAEKGVTVVDLQQVTGQIRAALAGTPGAFLRDNVHPSTFGSRIIARAIVEGMVSARCAMTTALPVRAAPTTWQQSGWTYNADNPLGFSISEDGQIQLGGTLVVNNAARSDGTTILQLPEVYRPPRQIRIVAWADGARPVLLLVEATGAVIVYGVSGGGTSVYFDAAPWPLS